MMSLTSSPPHPTNSIADPNNTPAENSPAKLISPFKGIDPYLIHPNDSPTVMFYSPLLTGDNYPSWVRIITKALNVKGKLTFVDGSLSPPTDPVEKALWKHCDDLVGITTSCEPNIRSSCLYADSTFTIWKDLQIRFFSQTNSPKLFQIKTAISNLKHDEKSVTVYYTQLKKLWDELDSLNSPETCICGANKVLLEHHTRDRAMEFLQGLHEKFAPIRNQILLIEPIPTAERMFNLVKQEEMQQIINSSTVPLVESAALQVHGSSHHFRSSTKRQRPFCDHCHRYGHTQDQCYHLHGFSNCASSQQAHNGLPVVQIDRGSSSL